MATGVTTVVDQQRLPGRVAWPAEPAEGVPPLESGDQLSRAEFERRYEAMPHVKKAELIEGVVYMPSPVKGKHGRPHGQIMAWLGAYCAATPGVGLYDNTTVRLGQATEVQPDALLRLEAGGRSQMSPDDYIEGAPELIVEIAATSASVDMHAKLRAYRRNGVQEYLVWQVYEQRVDWFELRRGEYAPLEPAVGRSGVLCSRVFPGLWLAVPSLLAGDLAAVLAELQQGLASQEHAALVQQLEAVVAWPVREEGPEYRPADGG
jgi:Uma2 family endonuclease